MQSMVRAHGADSKLVSITSHLGSYAIRAAINYTAIAVSAYRRYYALTTISPHIAR